MFSKEVFYCLGYYVKKSTLDQVVPSIIFFDDGVPGKVGQDDLDISNKLNYIRKRMSMGLYNNDIKRLLTFIETYNADIRYTVCARNISCIKSGDAILLPHRKSSGVIEWYDWGFVVDIGEIISFSIRISRRATKCSIVVLSNRRCHRVHIVTESTLKKFEADFRRFNVSGV